MRFIPGIPRDPASRLRLLSLWFALFAMTMEVGELAMGQLAPPALRVMGFVAVVLLAAWLAWGYQRRRFPPFSAPVDAVLLITIGAASSMPLRAMGVFLAAIQLRALYVSRREFWLLPLSYGVARIIAMTLTTQPAPYSGLSPTVLLQAVGMLFISGILFLLVASIDRQAEAERALTRSEERYRVLAAATHDMVYDWNLTTDAVTHSDAIRTVFGFADADVGQHRSWWLAQIHPADRPAYDSEFAALLESASGVATGLRYREDRNGSSPCVLREKSPS